MAPSLRPPPRLRRAAGARARAGGLRAAGGAGTSGVTVLAARARGRGRAGGAEGSRRGGERDGAGAQPIRRRPCPAPSLETGPPGPAPAPSLETGPPGPASAPAPDLARAPQRPRVPTSPPSPRPSGLGVTDYGSGVKTLGLCPATKNCISTAEAANDMNHYVPGWNYAPEDGRAMREQVSQSQAMAELKEVVLSTNPDKFTPTIVQETEDYLYVEYESPTFGFIDDVEFWFPGGGKTNVEYRSASRIGESDGDVNRKRIKALREELQKKGWKSVGFY